MISENLVIVTVWEKLGCKHSEETWKKRWPGSGTEDRNDQDVSKQNLSKDKIN